MIVYDNYGMVPMASDQRRAALLPIHTVPVRVQPVYLFDCLYA